jgi:hypothetical protein
MENRIKVEDEVKNRGGFRDESSHLYVVNIGKHLFLFPEEEFDKLGSIDRKTIWDTIDYVIANGITNDTKKDDDDKLVFDMYDLIAISHSIFLPPITLKVDITLDKDVNKDEFDTLRNDIPYHLIVLTMEKSGEYRIYIHKAMYESLNEDQTDKIADLVGYIGYSGCDKHEWIIDSECDLINFFNIIIFDVMPNHIRDLVVEEVERRGGFRDPKTGEYVLNPFPYVFVLPEWFENLEDSCRDNIYDICNHIATDPNQPKSNSTGSFTYKWDDIIACMSRYPFTQRKHYTGSAMEQLIDRQTKDRLSSFDTDITEDRIVFGKHSPLEGEITVSVKRCIWDTLYPSVQSELTMALQRIIKAHSNDKYPFIGWDLTSLESVYYFIEAAKRDPANLSQRTLVDMYIYTDALSREVYGVKVFDFTIGCVESFDFIVGKGSFFDKPLDNSVKESIEKEAIRIALLHSEEREASFKIPVDCYVWKLEGDHFVPYYPEPIPMIPDPDTEIKYNCNSMIGAFYVTDNDEIVKENIYEDEVRGERCKILKFTTKHNTIYFFSIEMATWNALDAVMEDMLITKARIVSKIGCSAHIWHFDSVGAIEEFINIPVVDKKNLLGLNNTNPNPNTIKEENTMFNKLKKNNDNLPKKEANNPAMPTPEQAKVIMDAMCACQTDISQYAEEMRRDRARANATMARAILTHGILTDDSMIDRNFLLPKDVKYPYATRMLDGELVVVTNGKPASDQVLTTINSVPVTNLQDYANILGTLNLAKEQSADHGLTAEEAASIVTNYIGCRDQALLNMLQDTNSLEKVIGEKTVKEIENTEFSNLMITTSPTVMKYITIEPVDEDGKK